MTADTLLERTLLSVCEDAFKYYPRLRRVKSFLDQHADAPLPLDTAAQVAALEKKYFSSYFRSKVGVPFATWVRCCHLLRAIELIAAEDFTLGEVAKRSGFAEVRTFERTFKKFVGLTPRQFKRQVLSAKLQ